MNKNVKEDSEVADILGAIEAWWDVFDIVKERYDSKVTFLDALQMFFAVTPDGMSYEEYLENTSPYDVAAKMYK